MEDCAAIARAASHAIGLDHWRRETHGALWSLTLHNPVRQTAADAFCDLAGVDLLSTINLAGQGDREGLAAQLRSKSESRVLTPLRVSPDDSWSDIFSKLLTSRIEPALGRDSLTFLCEYPIVEAALARPCAHDPRVAERFELYAFGLELANGYGELTDPAEQRRRLRAAMDEKDRRYGVRWPIDEDFLAALGQMPPASGCALGVDRLIMLATGASHIDQVLWNPLPSVE
jgi:lysyl-tRNA synthetase class 2